MKIILNNYNIFLELFIHIFLLFAIIDTLVTNAPTITIDTIVPYVTMENTVITVISVTTLSLTIFPYITSIYR